MLWTEIIEAKRAGLRAVVSDVATRDYAAALELAVQLSEMFKSELSAALERPLNAHVLGTPQDSLAEMRGLATRVNGALRQVGLALRDPRSGRHSCLVAEPRSRAEPEALRYRFQYTDERGRTVRSSPYASLPDLSIVPQPPRVEPFARDRRDPGGPPGRG